jgi:hypothetical protein
MPPCFKHFFAVLFLLFPIVALGQQKILTNQLVAAIDGFNNRIPAEKVFLQTDKPYYSSGDTIWMKAYVLDAALNYSKQSGLLYTELIDDTGKVIIRQSMPVKLGISFGQMALDAATVPEGGYTLRAYTNWMQNQGEQSFFTKQVYIGNAGNNAWLVDADIKLLKKQGVDNVQLALQLSDVNNQPLRLHELQLKVMQGNKVLNKDNLQTDIDGKINVNFSPPTQGKQLVAVLQDTRKGEGNKKLFIPISMNRPENMDLQFMPEGGQLVAGLRNWVGFKAIGEDGKGVDVRGEIIDSKENVITSFQSIHKGMGSFELMPGANETYSAKLVLPGAIVKTYPLPAVKASGISLHINSPVGSDSLYVTLNATDDAMSDTGRYSLIGQCDGKVCYAANLSFAKGIIHGKIDKERFKSGITRFTLFNGKQLPVAERAVFIDRHDGLNISINTEKAVYQPKDSIALHIKVTGMDNQPVFGSFSLAVTDDGQVKADSSNAPNIQSYMLLTGDLKGNVEEPGYYFDEKNTDRYTALDNLLLTQGWVAYDWKDVFSNKYQPAFSADPEIEITGHISRVGGKAVAGLPVMLLSTSKPVLMRDTVSDASGLFVFKNLPRIDTASFIIQAKDKKGRMFEANVNVDEFTPAKVSRFNNVSLTPWYVNTDSTLFRYISQTNAYNNELDKFKYPEGSRHLKEVKINAKKVVKGSHNLNGPGEADQILDEKDMLKDGKMTLLDIMLKQIKGFKPYNKIFDKDLKLVFDGINMDTFYDKNIYPNPDNYLFDILQQYTAEDIKGIEVMYNNQYNGTYTTTYNPDIVAFSATREDWPAYIEITTWSGNGLFQKRKHSNYIYRPLPVSWPKQFYHPKYTAKSNNTLADFRSTIDWEPNIITNTAGEATIWFYAKSKPGAYTVIVQGADLSGKVGAAKSGVIVK